MRELQEEVRAGIMREPPARTDKLASVSDRHITLWTYYRKAGMASRGERGAARALDSAARLPPKIFSAMKSRDSKTSGWKERLGEYRDSGRYFKQLGVFISTAIRTSIR